MKENLYTPEVGDVFEWCDEHYICQSSNKMSGVVYYLDATLASNNFYWNYADETCRFIRKATDKEMNKLKKLSDV